MEGKGSHTIFQQERCFFFAQKIVREGIECVEKRGWVVLSFFIRFFFLLSIRSILGRVVLLVRSPPFLFFSPPSISRTPPSCPPLLVLFNFGLSPTGFLACTPLSALLPSHFLRFSWLILGPVIGPTFFFFCYFLVLFFFQLFVDLVLFFSFV